jgi:hypothetical protein
MRGAVRKSGRMTHSEGCLILARKLALWEQDNPSERFIDGVHVLDFVISCPKHQPARG